MTTAPIRRATGLPLAAVLIALLVVGACRVGKTPAKSPAATSPRGVNVSLWEAGGSTVRAPTSGELLAVGEDGIFVVGPTGVTLYPFGTQWRLRPLDAPGTKVISLAQPDRAALETLARYARHPFGLQDGDLERLLAILGQDSVVVRAHR